MPGGSDGFELEAHGSGTADQRAWNHYYTARFPDGTAIDVTRHPSAPEAPFALELRPANGRPITDEQLAALAAHFRVGPASVRRLPVKPWHEPPSGGPATAALEQALEQELAAAAAAGFEPAGEDLAARTRKRIVAFLAERDALAVADAVADDAEDIAFGRHHLTVVHGDLESHEDAGQLAALYRAIGRICQGRERHLLETNDVCCLTVEGAGAEQAIGQVERAALELGFRPDQLTQARAPRGRREERGR